VSQPHRQSVRSPRLARQLVETHYERVRAHSHRFEVESRVATLECAGPPWQGVLEKTRRRPIPMPASTSVMDDTGASVRAHSCEHCPHHPLRYAPAARQAP